MGWQPGEEPRAGGEPGPDPAAPGGGPSGGPGARDPRLAGFARGGEWDARPPSAALAAALEGAAGPAWRCPGAEHGELLGAVRKAQALESWACAAKLGLLRALIREEDMPLPGGDHHGDLPDGWSKSLTHEVALALATSPVTAERLMRTAWDLEALLPGVGALLADGTLTYSKAKVIDENFEPLSEEDRARAEAMILPDLAGKPCGKIEQIAARAAIAIDPGSAERRREHAERNRARVVLKRERSGAAMLSGYDLPPAETLAAHSKVCARAQQYKDCGAFPGVFTDQLRALAYLDLMNGVTAEDRIAAGPPDTGLGAPATDGAPGGQDPGGSDADGQDACDGPRDCACRECDGSCWPADNDSGNPGDDDPDNDSGDPGDDGPGGPPGGHPGGGSGPDGDGAGDPDSGQGPDDDETSGSGTSPDCEAGSGAAGPPPPQSPSALSSPWSASPLSPPPPRLTDLVLPLAALLGLARRPGDSHGFGPLDPGLCRALAALAASSPHTTACVTVADENGYAIGHGCLRSGRRAAQLPGAPAPPLTALPARLNLTITASCLTGLTGLTGRTEAAREAGGSGPLSGIPGPLGGTDARGSAPPGSTSSGSTSSAGWAFAPRARPDGPGARDALDTRATSGARDALAAGGDGGGADTLGADTSSTGSPRAGTPGDPSPPGGPDWCGDWVITLPRGLEYTVRLEPVPTHDCDHRRESHAYQPNDALRHLVQIRDRECTFPTCSRHARESDFEHAIPYHKGGRTCGCNAGARSRQCHQVKQSKGWNVTQPKPGWHQWETPSGRVYVQAPWRYPV